MKKKTAEQLSKLMKVRTLLEQMQHQTAKRHQEAIVAQAETLKRKAITDAPFDDTAPCPQSLKHWANHTADLIHQARSKLHEAAAMQGTVIEKEEGVRSAFRSEIAADGLLQSAIQRERKARSDHDESQREQQNVSAPRPLKS